MALPTPDRRAAARFEVVIEARLLSADGGNFAAMIRNISSSGLLASVAAGDVAALLPNVERELRHLPVRVLVAFTAGEAWIEVECGIAQLRRVSATGCELGLQFRDFRDDGAARLDEFCARLGAAFAHPGADP
ncbi:MAG: PilZ domain-containing protein [Pseudomonadales bacterium]|nr:PilZ domain-containing protein [Pseudomonadales bacterium]